MFLIVCDEETSIQRRTRLKYGLWWRGGKTVVTPVIVRFPKPFSKFALDAISSDSPVLLLAMLYSYILIHNTLILKPMKSAWSLRTP
jgi:hypothetical protein